MKKFFMVGGIMMIILILIVVLVFIIYGLTSKTKPDKPVIDYTRIVSTPVFNAFVDFTNKDRLAHSTSPLSNNEKFQTNVAMGIAKSIYAKYTPAITKALAAKANISLYVQKMKEEFADTAIGMKIAGNIISNVTLNYLAKLPYVKPEDLIKVWSASN